MIPSCKQRGVLGFSALRLVMLLLSSIFAFAIFRSMFIYSHADNGELWNQRSTSWKVRSPRFASAASIFSRSNKTGRQDRVNQYNGREALERGNLTLEGARLLVASGQAKVTAMYQARSAHIGSFRNKYYASSDSRSS